MQVKVDNNVHAISIDDMVDIVEAIENVKETHLKASVVYEGVHPEYGFIYVVSSATGDNILIVPTASL